MKIMELDLKRVHMARCELILKQVRAIWPRIISKPLLTPKAANKGPKTEKESKVNILPITETRAHGELGLV